MSTFIPPFPKCLETQTRQNPEKKNGGHYAGSESSYNFLHHFLFLIIAHSLARAGSLSSGRTRTTAFPHVLRSSMARRPSPTCSRSNISGYTTGFTFPDSNNLFRGDVRLVEDIHAYARKAYCISSRHTA